MKLQGKPRLLDTIVPAVNKWLQASVSEGLELFSRCYAAWQ